MPKRIQAVFSRVATGGRDDWETPAAVFDPLDEEFRFSVDVAAAPHNAKARPFFSAEDNALACDWRVGGRGRVCWMNPPYSQCRPFMAKAALEVARGCTVVALVPARTDTRWWHEHVWDMAQHRPRAGVEVRFLRGRVKFSGASTGAPFPSAVVVMRPTEAAA